MNFRHSLLIIWAFLSCLTACKHQEEVNPTPTSTDQSDDPSKDATPVGQPKGAPTTQTIGPEGGTIKTPDGTVKLVLPAGAVSKATTITIQPITNSLISGLGKAYRFTPEGLEFAKPATLTFAYDPAKVTAGSFNPLGVAFQGKGNAWYDVEGSSADTIKHEISVSMPHFSDWTPYQAIQMGVDFGNIQLTNDEMNFDGKVKCGESVSLYCVNLNWISNTERRLQSFFANTEWHLYGAGKIDTDAGPDAIYTAPKTVPKDNPVTLTAKIHFKGRTEEVIVFQRIYIIGDNYFRGTVDGVPFDWPAFNYAADAGIMHVYGGTDGDIPNINLIFYGNTENPVGAYPYSASQKAVIGAYDLATGIGYTSYYYDCGGQLHLSKDGIHITKIERKDGREVIEGNFSMTAYRTIGVCPGLQVKELPITGEFRLDRSK